MPDADHRNSEQKPKMSLSDAIAPHLPFLRRYARVLTGSQAGGDAYVAAALEAIIVEPDQFPRDVSARVGLFRIFHVIWSSTNIDVPPPAEAIAPFDRAAAVDRLMALTPERRQALLLVSLEGFSVREAGFILDRDDDTVEEMLAAARDEIDGGSRVDVLIIEDEPIISIDLRAIVTEMGHRVVGIATTRSQAVALALKSPPELVLADIQLADGSSGIDAVKDILEDITAPVIFITAFPERLLTGERPEPTFLISKPFLPDTVKAAIAQALFVAEDRKRP